MVANGVGLQSRSLKVLGAMALTAVTLGVVAPQANAQRTVIQIDGSSTVFPITEAVAEEFIGDNPDFDVTVGISGTGGGFQKFCNGETDISNASRPIKPEEMEACRAAGIEYIELPIAYDALTVVINPSNTWATSMTVEQLRMLWEPDAQGVIESWSDINPSWPNMPIIFYSPGADSGTFDYFTEAIVDTDGASRADAVFSEDDNVLVQGVAGDQGAIGYFGLAYYEENMDVLTAVAIDGGNGPVLPTREAVNSGAYVPLSRPLFIYVSTAALDRPEVQTFVNYYLDNAPALSSEVGYVPLPEDAYQAAIANFTSRKVGSVFAGRDTIGVSITELLELETQQ
jgi:phosphate transport system substrate-binding protein